MICANCSAAVADAARFCHSCGSLVSDAEGQAAVSASMDRSSFQHMERLLREETKGEFTIQRMIGRGGMAVVYLATETRLARQVAIKVLPPELTFGNGVERFNREARTAAALDHPHIIPIYRISSNDKLFWYAMKYLKGQSLDDLLRDAGSLSLEEALEILEQVADALDYAHEHHVIHRDVKPANVMLDERNRAIVTDFGIAKAIHEGKLTATDSMVGTPYYMSPEQGMGKAITGAADQYSVAVMAYRMLAGRLPFEGDSVIDILHKHCMFPAPRLRDQVRDLPAHVSSAVARALAKSGHERFADVHEFVQAMRDPKFVPTPVTRPSIATQRMMPMAGKATAAVGSGPRSDEAGRTAIEVSQRRVSRKSVARVTPVVPERAPKRSRAWLSLSVASLVLAGSVITWQVVERSSSPDLEQDVATIIPPDSSPALVAESQSDGAAGALDSTGPMTGVPPLSRAPTAVASSAPEDTRPTPAVEAGRARVESQSKPTPSTEASGSPRNATSGPAPGAAGGSARAQSVAAATERGGQATASAPTFPASPGASGTTPIGTDTLIVFPNVAATIEIDGRSYGERLRLREVLTAGPHVVRVSRSGFVTRTDTVSVQAGRSTTIRPSLERLP